MDDRTQTQSTMPDSGVSQIESADKPTPANRVGQQLGNYRLTQRLASGGFAEVYLGEHIHLNTLAAIKVLQAQLSSDELEKFRTEARTVAGLRHPHIVSVLDFDVQNDIPFLVMDYAPHGSLRHHHPKGSILSLTEVRQYLAQLADALQYAHDRRIIHRDVKPENMLLSEQNEVLLSDFGIAVALLTVRMDVRHEIMGTVSYMAPEQFDGKVLPASDQYALGAVVYEWLCGACPFQGSIAEVIAQHCTTLPPPINERNPQVSLELEQIIFRALAKDPEQRYPSIQEFARTFALASRDHRSNPPRMLSFTALSSLADYQAETITVEPVHHEPPREPEEATNYQVKAEEDPSATQVHPPAEQNDVQIVAPQQKQQTLPRISRRKILLSISGLATLGIAGGGLTWFLRTHHPHANAKQHRATPSATPTPTPPPGKQLIIYRGHIDEVRALAWSPDGTYIASASNDKTVRVWTMDSGADQKSFTGHTDIVNAVAWSPDGQHIASASNDKTVQVWPALQDGNPLSYTNHTSEVNAVAWSTNADPNAQYIVSGGNDHMVRIWKPADGTDVATYNRHGDTIHAVVWSPDNKYAASASADKTVLVWDVTKTENDATPIVSYQGHNDAVNFIAWSPDGTMLASASADKTVQIWDALHGGSPHITYSNHSAPVNAVAWSPDGQRLASASDDGTVRVWNAQDGNDVLTYTGHTNNAVHSVMWSPDGMYIASASADKTVQIWYS